MALQSLVLLCAVTLVIPVITTEVVAERLSAPGDLAANRTTPGDSAGSRGGADASGVADRGWGRELRPLLQQTDARFGVVVGASPPNVADAVRIVGASSWYTYGNHTGPGGKQIALVRPTEPYDPNEFTRRARDAPGGIWLIGNEPNMGGQDDISPEGYAQFLVWVAGLIRAADPTAILVGPGVLNWDATCTGCGGMTPGRAWSEAFVTIYQQRYGPLPLNAWAMHAYTIDWTRLPMLDSGQDQAQLVGARAWLDSKGLNLPIWLTEFGVVYGWDGLQWVQQADGYTRAVPQGRFRTDLIAPYLDRMLDWLVRNGAALRIDRWFLYGLAPTTELWATAPVGISLLQANSLNLSSFGEQYVSWAQRCPLVAVSAGAGSQGHGPLVREGSRTVPSSADCVPLPALTPETTRTPTASPSSPATATPTATLVPSPIPGSCAPRPNVRVSVTPDGVGRVQVTITANSVPVVAPNNRLVSLRFGAAVGALIDIPNGPAGGTGNLTVSLPAGTQQTTFLVRQATPGSAATVPLEVVDACGAWSTFVGAGPEAFAGRAPTPTTPEPTAVATRTVEVRP
jgi:hypothetical protein